MVGGRGGEGHGGAEVVGAGFAAGAAAAGHAGFEGHAVADPERRYCRADAGDCAGGFVAEDHGGGEDEAADGAVRPVVYLGERGWGLAVVWGGLCGGGRETGEEGGRYIAAADTGPIDVDEDVVVGLEFGDGSVFELDLVGRFKHEREVLE